MLSGIERPLRCGLGWATKPQSRSEPRLSGHWAGSMTSGDIVAAARLDQQDADIGVLGQT